MKLGNYISLCLIAILVTTCNLGSDDIGNSIIDVPAGSSREEIIALASQVKPSERQRLWHQHELSAFFHFGLNTFTDREWGDGTDDPASFNPTDLDIQQWIDVIKSAGFTKVIITAKHHDGFCLWPSKLTDYTIARSPYRGGDGDIIQEISTICKKEKIALGLYISPWDRHEQTYGTEAYDAFYLGQLEELLNDYGPISEIWMDGANGEGVNGTKHAFAWEAYFNKIRELQPECVISIKGPDVRWVGTENGYGRETEWSVIPIHKDTTRAPNLMAEQGPWQSWNIDPMSPDLGSNQKLLEAEKLIWYPAQVDVSIRPGWFYHANQDDQVKNALQLLDIYFNSVGKNAALLLNIPPDKRGKLALPDVIALQQFRSSLNQIFTNNKAKETTIEASSEAVLDSKRKLIDDNPESYWEPIEGDETPSLTLSFATPQKINVIAISEYIQEGQQVASFLVDYWDGEKWMNLTQGTTIGYRRLLRTPTIITEHLRIIFTEYRDVPKISAVGVFKNLPDVTFDPKGVAFADQIKVQLIPDDSSAQIHFTTDGSTPTLQSLEYQRPVVLLNTAEIKAISVLPNGIKGFVASEIYNKAQYKVLLENAPSIRYTAGGSLILTDGIYGGTQYDNNRWLGFEGDDLIAIIDLGELKTFERIAIDFLHDPSQHIYLPQEVFFYAGTQITRLRRIGRSFLEQPESDQTFSQVVTKQFSPQKARYIKIVGKNYGVTFDDNVEEIPSWLFVDEIEIQ